MTNEIKTKFPILEKELRKECAENIQYQINRLNLTQDDINKEIAKGRDNHKTPTEVLNYVVRWTLDKRTSYKGTYEEQKAKTINALNNKYTKALNKELEYLNAIAEAEKLPNRLIINTEWKKSYMWGANPTATDNYGNSSGSIGGCGYDKRSTATARILNEHLYFIKLMCEAKEKHLKNNPSETIDNNQTHRDVLGYGSGYGIIPKFEGGVGVSCHQTILNKLGWKFDHVSNTANTDVYIIEEGA